MLQFYISRSGIIYLIFTLACLPSTALVAKLGVKTSLVLASVPYLLNILQLFTLNPAYIYFMAGEGGEERRGEERRDLIR